MKTSAVKEQKKPLQLLLADDDAEDEARLRVALNKALPGVRIESKSNGIQLVEHLLTLSQKNKPLPDIVFTDLYMPFAGGLQVLKQIRLQPKLKHIPIYVFSRNCDNNIKSRVIENGGIEFHQKPEDPVALQQIVDGIVAKAGLAVTMAG